MRKISSLIVASCLWSARGNEHPERRLVNNSIRVVSTSQNPGKLGLCEGDCDHDHHCQEGLRCFQRTRYEAVPGCSGGESDKSRTDYCVLVESAITPTGAPVVAPTGAPVVAPTGAPVVAIEETPSPFQEHRTGHLVSFGGNPPTSKMPLGLCEGDCDNDGHCQGNLICFQRSHHDPVPGCTGYDASKTDYCIDPLALLPTNSPDSSLETDYIPGKLTVNKIGLLLSQGLDAKLVATSGQHVEYDNGGLSSVLFHSRPDGGATFPDTRAGNEGGFVYVSNSEMKEDGEGGVGAITFDADANILDYKMVLTDTTMNCGGGRTPWNTWVSCEERGDRQGHAYQVDPFGERAQVMTMGSEGGRWESFAFDDRDELHPQFFMTEDDTLGALCRFTPSSINTDDQWETLHGEGTTDYLILSFSTSSGGTFDWTTNREVAMANAKSNYPLSEGIDVSGSQLLFVCKKIRMIYSLNLDDGTWFRSSTVSGLFDGHPDQIQRILQDPKDLVYFTEEGGKDAGIHARDEKARFFTIMESPVYPGETTGLSLSPDRKFMFVAYQDVGKLFCLWRRDGKQFGAEHLDIKYHES